MHLVDIMNHMSEWILTRGIEHCSFLVHTEKLTLSRNGITGTLPEDIYLMESLGMSVLTS